MAWSPPAVVTPESFGFDNPETTLPSIPTNPATPPWADPVTERYYFADRSNFGVEVIDAEKDVWVGRVKGMAAPLPSGGRPRNTNGPRPNGVVGNPPKRLASRDGESPEHVGDVDPTT